MELNEKSDRSYIVICFNLISSFFREPREDYLNHVLLVLWAVNKHHDQPRAGTDCDCTSFGDISTISLKSL